MSRSTSALESLDDDHAPAAARARMRERLGFSLTSAAGIAEFDACWVYVEQLTRPRDVVGASAIGEEAIVTDAVEAARQDVDQEAADELVDGERHHLGPMALRRTPGGPHVRVARSPVPRQISMLFGG